MNKILYQAAFFVGLIAVGWVGFGYLANPLALLMTLLIAAFYLMGAVELRRFHQATATLDQALAVLPADLPALGEWLARLHASLQNPVRLRIEGARTGLPGPVMTPYLAGLLVLLGMLGTFLGMVVTLKGTAIALESTTDLQAIRASLAAPVKGLGLAFGTSVAGVSASAMLGLMSALCRRARLQSAQRLDSGLAGGLRVFTPAHQREESFKTLQLQTRLMPELVDRLQAMMAQMERQSAALNERLLAGQEGFYRQAETAYAGLASAVHRSLETSLADSARAAGASIQPVVEATMSGIARETRLLQGRLTDAVTTQLEGLSARFAGTVTTVSEVWTNALAQHQRSSEALGQDLRHTLAAFGEGFEQRAASLVDAVGRSHAAAQGDLLRTVDASQAGLQARLVSQDEARLEAWRESMASIAESLRDQWQQAALQAREQQRSICETLERSAHEIGAHAEAQAGRTLAEIGRLVQAAAEAPRAAAEVIAELRQKLSDSLVQDKALLEERSRVMQTLGTLLDAVNHASTEQRSAIDALVATSAGLLERVGQRFAEQVEAESAKIGAAAAQVTGSAIEVASLGEAFGFGVQRFGESNDKLLAQLQAIEAALAQSSARSDEQLAYYVAQAREVIDLSIGSQKQIVDALQQLARRQAELAGEAG